MGLAVLIVLLVASLGICNAAWPGHYGHPPVSVAEVATFTIGTWIENLAVRSNGKILASSASTPQIWQVDPTDQAAAFVVATIPDHLSLAGITEVPGDVFYVAANNFSVNNGPSIQPNSSAMYRVDFTQQIGSGTVEPVLVASFANSGLLNGAATFNADRGIVLVGDAALGHVWRLNVVTGEKVIAAADPLMTVNDTTKEPIGVNGLKIKGDWLYFSNTNQEILARVRLDAEGFAVGKAELLVTYPAPDDVLPISGRQGACILLAGNAEILFYTDRGIRVVSDDPLLKGSTAIRKGTDREGWGVFFVSTNGGVGQFVDGNVTVPGRIVRLDL